MKSHYACLLKEKLGGTFQKLEALKSEKLNDFLGEYIELCNPATVRFCDDSEEDAAYIRSKSLERGEERQLARPNQTIHFDGYNDQAREAKNTKFLAKPEDMAVMSAFNAIDYETGLAEIKSIAKGIMAGREAIVKIYCEGPAFGPFTKACVQFTDSAYVTHSENILYRGGYAHFKSMKDKGDFYGFVHSAGQMDANMNCVNLDKRRVYMDMEKNIVYSMNAQYAGNSVGLKKHSMRLAINEGGKNGWLCEHMFLMTVLNDAKKRKCHFAGAFPSACGKTATAMIPGEKILGDDIVYFKKIEGEFRAVNVENGIFGIIKDVNEKDDPVIYRTLCRDKEMIFSNILVGEDNMPYWEGMGLETPKKGRNHSGDWFEGKADDKGKKIPLAHSNSRYTMRLDYLENIDPDYNKKDGVKVDVIVYGGRDSDTTVPVEESKSWKDGIVLKAVTLESETTSATIGQEGVRVINPMANIEFLGYSLGKYIDNNVKFAEGLEASHVPKIISVNYFLKSAQGKFCTSKLAKKVWLHWAEARVHNEVGAYETPTGFIPKYEDLAPLFKQFLPAEKFSEEDYKYQFSFRCSAWLAKIGRAVAYLKKNAPDCPAYVYEMLDGAAKRIEAAKAKHGDMIAPGSYKG